MFSDSNYILKYNSEIYMFWIQLYSEIISVGLLRILHHMKPVGLENSFWKQINSLVLATLCEVLSNIT